MTGQSPVLEVIGVSKSFPGVIALESISFHVAAGEAVALVGANGAGKSTLMNILGGVIQKSSGAIRLEGAEADLRSPIDSQRQGIAFVSQELNSIPTMSLAENIFPSGLPKKNGFIDLNAAEKISAELMARLGFEGDVTQFVGKLSTGDRQLVEIARALRQQPKVLIFDEPTSSLSKAERSQLFGVVHSIKQSGVAVIYITHFLEEIFEVCDRVSVLRNGKNVFEAEVSNTNPQQVVHQMMGSAESEERLTPYDRKFGTTRLDVLDISQGSRLNKVSFALSRGEIVGLWGLLGSGRTEILRCMTGIDSADQAEMRWHTEDGEVEQVTPAALQKRTGYVTEDRRREGLFLPKSVADNIALPSLKSLSNSVGMVRNAMRNVLARSMIDDLNIKVSSQEQICANLSGGNQQKVVFARWLALKPMLFLLDEPTRGLDVNAKTEILKIVADLSGQGCTVLIVSSELEELMRICDRYLIMSQGTITGELPANATRKQLLDAVSVSATSTKSQTVKAHAVAN